MCVFPIPHELSSIRCSLICRLHHSTMLCVCLPFIFVMPMRSYLNIDSNTQYPAKSVCQIIVLSKCITINNITEKLLYKIIFLHIVVSFPLSDSNISPFSRYSCTCLANTELEMTVWYILCKYKMNNNLFPLKQSAIQEEIKQVPKLL